MNKSEKINKSEVKQVAKEALDLVIKARKKDLDEERRAQVRLNRGHESAWAEANYASKFISAVYKEIDKMGVEYEDLVISEQLSMERLVSDRAKDVAFDWASFEAQKEASVVSDAKTRKSYARKINASQVRELLGDYLMWEELNSLLDDLYHDCDDDSCVTVAVESIRALVEARQFEAAKAAERERYARELDEQVEAEVKDIEAEARAEKLVHDATNGTMTLDQFREYVNSGQWKRDVEEALEIATGMTWDEIVNYGDVDENKVVKDSDPDAHMANNDYGCGCWIAGKSTETGAYGNEVWLDGNSIKRAEKTADMINGYVEVKVDELGTTYYEINSQEVPIDENKADTDYEEYVKANPSMGYAIDPDKFEEWSNAISLDKVTVDEGDSLMSIAKVYSIEVEALAQINPEYMDQAQFMYVNYDQIIGTGTVLNLPANTPFPVGEDGKGKTTIVFSLEPGATRYEYDNGVLTPVTTDKPTPRAPFSERATVKTYDLHKNKVILDTEDQGEVEAVNLTASYLYVGSRVVWGLSSDGMEYIVTSVVKEQEVMDKIEIKVVVGEADINKVIAERLRRK